MKANCYLILSIFIFIFHHAAQASKVIVGASPILSSAGIYLAQEKGYFKDEGLSVEITDFNNSGAAMTLLLSKGDMDVGAGNLTSGLFNAILKGENIKLVADKGHLENNKEYIGLIVRKDHVDSGRFKTTKDLKGMKISLTALDGVSQQVVMDKILEAAGLTEKDVEYVKLSYAEANVALKTKSIDATIQLEPFLTKAIMEGTAVEVVSAQKIIPDQQSASIIYSGRFIKEKPDEAVKFMKAYIKGIRFYNASLKDKIKWQEVVKLLKKNIKIDDDKVWSAMQPIGLNENGYLNLDSLRDDLLWYIKKGFVAKNAKVETFIDHSFVSKAVGQLKK